MYSVRARAFFLESLMQSESAVGVRGKIYWPYSIATFGQQLFPNGDLLCVKETLQSLLPCGLHTGVMDLFPRDLPKANTSTGPGFWNFT